jgi:hypothetical protein
MRSNAHKLETAVLGITIEIRSNRNFSSALSMRTKGGLRWFVDAMRDLGDSRSD